MKYVYYSQFVVFIYFFDSSRRMGTRGVERGVKNDFKQFMRKQIFKNAQENLEALIIKFLTLNKSDIITCLEV